eukprot:116047-Hanusia_phi.AAC.1
MNPCCSPTKHVTDATRSVRMCTARAMSPTERGAGRIGQLLAKLLVYTVAEAAVHYQTSTHAKVKEMCRRRRRDETSGRRQGPEMMPCFHISGNTVQVNVAWRGGRGEEDAGEVMGE